MRQMKRARTQLLYIGKSRRARSPDVFERVGTLVAIGSRVGRATNAEGVEDKEKCSGHLCAVRHEESITDMILSPRWQSESCRENSRSAVVTGDGGCRAGAQIVAFAHLDPVESAYEAKGRFRICRPS